MGYRRGYWGLSPSGNCCTYHSNSHETDVELFSPGVRVWVSDENAPIFDIVEQAVRVVNDTTPERVVAGPANEGYLLIERGIPTVCGLGPSGENAHAANEYVEIQGLLDAAGIYCLTARGLSDRLIHPHESIEQK